MIGKGFFLKDFHANKGATVYLDGVEYEGKFYLPYETIPSPDDYFSSFGFPDPGAFDLLVQWEMRHHTHEQVDGPWVGECTCGNDCEYVFENDSSEVAHPDWDWNNYRWHYDGVCFAAVIFRKAWAKAFWLDPYGIALIQDAKEKPE